MKKIFSYDRFLEAMKRKKFNTSTFSLVSGISTGTLDKWKKVKNIKKQSLIEAVESILDVKYDDLCVPEEVVEDESYIVEKNWYAGIKSFGRIPPKWERDLSNTESVDLTHYESDEYDHDKQWPIIGSTRGGQWLETVESGYPGVGEGLTEAPEVKDANGYALKVIGDSMEPEFPEGGIVLVSPSSSFVNGDFAVVIIESRLGDRRESCMKQVFKYKDHITLHSLNDRYKDVDIPDGEVIAIHKVIEYRLTKIKKYV